MTTPYLFQLKDVRRIARMNGRALCSHEMGLGKAQPIDAKILTPSGWKLMGEIRVGDLVVGANGRPTTVIGVYPQGVKQVFNVLFSDKSGTQCCSEHLWSVNTPAGKHAGEPPMIMSLEEMMGEGFCHRNGNRRFYIPVVKPVHFNSQLVPLEPYLMGYLIANGCTRYGASLTIPDDETAHRIAKLVPHGLKLIGTKGSYDYDITRGNKRGGPIPNVMKEAVREMGMLGKYTHEKSIPPQYLFNSVRSRIALLQGMMDGDGSVSSNGDNVSYSTSSPWLARDFQHLVQSLGGVAKMRIKKNPKYTHKGEIRTGRTSYVFTINLPNDIAPFRLSRKLDRVQPKTKYNATRAIVSVTPAGEKECVCISVDSPDKLYVTDDFIVTHNTLISLLYIHRHPECLPAVIVCPAPLKYQWSREAARHFGLRAEVLSGVNPIPFGIAGTPPAVIVNYDILGPSRYGPGWVDALKELNPQMVIIDESTSIKDPRSQRCRAVKKLCQGVPNVLALSATPIEIRPMELWSTLNILQPKKFPSQWRFGHTYCGAKKTHWGWSFDGASNLNQLTKELDSIMIRRRKADVIKELPKKIRTVVPLELSDPRQYELASSDFLKWVMKTAPGKLPGAVRSAGLAKAGHLKRLAAELKLPAAIAWVDLWLESNPGKILLFCHHKKIVKLLHDHYRKTCVVVDGSVTGKKRQAAVDQFQNNASTRVFIGNMDAAGKGLNLTAAYAVAFFEYPWKPTTVVQAEDRCFARLSDIHGAQIFFLTAVGTVEERIAALIQRRQKLVSKVLDGEGDSEELDLFDMLLTELRKGK